MRIKEGEGCGKTMAPGDVPEWRFSISVDQLKGPSESLSRAAHSLRQNGCVLLEPSLVNQDLCAAAATCAEDDLRELLRRVVHTFPHIDPLRDRILSRELCNRSEGGRRYDTDLSKDAQRQEPWREILDVMRDLTRPILTQSSILGEGAQAGRVYTVGCVTSLAGGIEQGWHRDGDEAGCVNVFCPLVDVHEANGPTEIMLGSHLWSRQDAAAVVARGEGSLELADYTTVRACARKGSLLLFDFRCLHRGARHAPTPQGAEGLDAPARPVLYAVAARPGMLAWDFFDHPPLLASGDSVA